MSDPPRPSECPEDPDEAPRRWRSVFRDLWPITGAEHRSWFYRVVSRRRCVEDVYWAALAIQRWWRRRKVRRAREELDWLLGELRGARTALGRVNARIADLARRSARRGGPEAEYGYSNIVGPVAGGDECEA